MINDIVNFFGKAADYLNADYVFYGAAGLTAVVFVIMLFCAAGAAKARKAAESGTKALTEGGADGLEADMKGFSKAAKGAWKNYRASQNAAAAVYLTPCVCVDAPARPSKNAARNYFFIVIVIAALAFVLNLLLIKGAPISTSEAIAPLAVLVLGGILAAVLAAVNNARYNKALAAYNEFIAVVNRILPVAGQMLALPAGATVVSETYDAKTDEPVFEFNVDEKPAEPAEPPHAPAYWTMSDADGSEPSFGPSEDIYSVPQKEDIVAQVERITAAGASKQTMLEVAKLLQAERAKAENKTLEQQTRLNSALATLLKAISSAK